MSKVKVKNRFSQVYYHAPIEAFTWISGLILLALYHPSEDQHISICLLKGIGFEFCPGCGLGRAVSSILHGEFYLSWQTHPLGFFALGVLLYRIFRLMKFFIWDIFLNKPYHGKRIETFTGITGPGNVLCSGTDQGNGK
ncbi:MAG: DUF2752 domain-containing protein [Cyclobacteriaceae bacterium]|nr:DUF2752 domain-containing protein [Cyclobacteriaceae bacterium]